MWLRRGYSLRRSLIIIRRRRVRDLDFTTNHSQCWWNSHFEKPVKFGLIVHWKPTQLYAVRTTYWFQNGSLLKYYIFTECQYRTLNRQVSSVLDTDSLLHYLLYLRSSTITAVPEHWVFWIIECLISGRLLYSLCLQ